MSLQVSVGISEGEDSYTVGANACQDAIAKLGSESADLAIVFASSKYDQNEMLKGVISVSKEALLVGSSTAGEITTEGPAKKSSVAVMLMKSPNIKFYAAVGENVAADARAAGKKAAEEVKKLAGTELKAFMMIPDVLVGNGADIVRGVLDSLGEHFPVVGGASGDDFKFEKTYQYLHGKVYSGSVVGLGLVGNFKIGIGVKHGWLPVGVPMKVTKSQGAVLHELDGKPAINLYRDYFGAEEAQKLQKETLAKLAITYPLGMTVEGSDEMLIRDPITVDEKGSITCAAEIPEGSEIRLMVGSREEAVKVAKIAAEKAVEQLDGLPPKAVIIFNCIARNKLFGEHSGEEISAIQEVVGKATPLIGFYTYGEQAPLGGEVRNINKCNPVFHNETVVICALAD
ncbi:MAG: FIST C-terminal domain-containing protein [Candidatus Zambryskibacteria bacterium]|nr:FIST C-terminal domain-containing protein [Candidatus Zambryskibacteria bacterium]